MGDRTRKRGCKGAKDKIFGGKKKYEVKEELLGRGGRGKEKGEMKETMS
jgi:hypothetical protein